VSALPLPDEPAGPMPEGPSGPAAAGRSGPASDRSAADPPAADTRALAALPVRLPLLPALVTVVVVTGVAATGALLGLPALLAATAVLQVAVVLAWWWALDPPGPTAVIAVALAVALAGDAAVGYGRPAGLGLLGAVLALTVPAAFVGQLVRGVARARVTEAYAATVALALLVAGLATLPAAYRQWGGPTGPVAAVLAAGAAVGIARLVDTVAAVPRLSAGLRRGGLGVILGAMAGTAAAAGYGALAPGLDARAGALVGWAAGLVAVLADLAASYAAADRTVAEVGRGRRARRPGGLLGPLVAVAAAGPVAYVLLAMVLG